MLCKRRSEGTYVVAFGYFFSCNPLNASLCCYPLKFVLCTLVNKMSKSSYLFIFMLHKFPGFKFQKDGDASGSTYGGDWPRDNWPETGENSDRVGELLVSSEYRSCSIYIADKLSHLCSNWPPGGNWPRGDRLESSENSNRVGDCK